MQGKVYKDFSEVTEKEKLDTLAWFITSLVSLRQDVKKLFWLFFFISLVNGLLLAALLNIVFTLAEGLL